MFEQLFIGNTSTARLWLISITTTNRLWLIFEHLFISTTNTERVDSYSVLNNFLLYYYCNLTNTLNNFYY